MREELLEKFAVTVGELLGGLAHLKIVLEDEHLEAEGKLASAKLMVGALLEQARPVYEKVYEASAGSKEN